MKKHLQDSDLALFRQEVQDAEQLGFESAEPFRDKPPPVPRPRPGDEPDDDDLVNLAEAEVETQEYLLFARPGIQHRVVADLQRGAFEVGLELDLHGLYAEHARRILGEFLSECAHRRVRCARIIHGKGYGSSGRQPVLKQKVNYWLRLRNDVLAFCSATRRDGGTGAVYVLLRNPSKAGRPRSPR